MILKDLTQLENLVQNKEYKGDLKNYQTKGNSYKGKKYMKYERDTFNQYQNILYKRALYGLKVFSEEELSSMHRDKKKRISKVHKRAQKTINIMKQEKVNQITNRIFEFFFPKTNITKSLLELENDTDADYVNSLELKGLGITKEHIINRFVGEGILPKNFHNIKQNEIK